MSFLRVPSGAVDEPVARCRVEELSPEGTPWISAGTCPLPGFLTNILLRGGRALHLRRQTAIWVCSRMNNTLRTQITVFLAATALFGLSRQTLRDMQSI